MTGVLGSVRLHSGKKTLGFHTSTSAFRAFLAGNLPRYAPEPVLIGLWCAFGEAPTFGVWVCLVPVRRFRIQRKSSCANSMSNARNVGVL